MSMDATVQIRMDSQTKLQVEELYRSLGTSFAEAVRMFAQQSIKMGGLPFQPTLKTWDELTEEEIAQHLAASKADIQAGRVLSLEELDARMRARYHWN